LQNHQRKVEKPRVVLKFGGSSVAKPKNWETISEIVRQKISDGEQPLVVSSALGGSTDSLIELYKLAANGRRWNSNFEALTKRYSDMCDQMGLRSDDILLEEYAALESLLNRTTKKGGSAARHARIVAAGERMTTLIGAAFLENRGFATKWLDARRYLKSETPIESGANRYFLGASCDYSEDSKLIQAMDENPGGVTITQGFVAGTALDETVLLGRGGSDTSAAYFAAKTSAVRLEIWTDVPGMFSANPHWVEDARLIRQMAYEDAASLAASGAKILHPRCVRPAREAGIPIHVKCTRAPHLEGSVIQDLVSSSQSGLLSAITSRHAMAVIAARTLSSDLSSDQNDAAFVDALKKRQLLPEHMRRTDQGMIQATIDTVVTPFDNATEKALIQELLPQSSTTVHRDLAAISICGSDLDSQLPEIRSASSALENHNVRDIYRTHDERSLNFLLDGMEQPKELVTTLHRELISDSESDYHGPTWKELQEVLTAPSTQGGPINVGS